MVRPTISLSMALILAGAVCTAALAGPVFTVVPSEITHPAGVALGDFRRSFQPFENWTLICDEDMHAQRRICNIRQEIAVEGAGTIFSWAMAATDSGQERMVVTAPSAIGQGGEIRLSFEGGTAYTAYVTCSPQACTTTIPVGPQIRRHIENSLSINISFIAPPVGELQFAVPMKGMADALKAVGK